MVTPEGLGGRAQLTSHPPVLLQLPGGYKHGDLSVSPVPEILHRHGNAPAGEEVLETVPGGGVGVRGTNEGAIFCPRNGPASPPSLRTSPGQHRASEMPGHQHQHQPCSLPSLPLQIVSTSWVHSPALCTCACVCRGLQGKRKRATSTTKGLSLGLEANICCPRPRAGNVLSTDSTMRANEDTLHVFMLTYTYIAGSAVQGADLYRLAR